MAMTWCWWRGWGRGKTSDAEAIHLPLRLKQIRQWRVRKEQMKKWSASVRVNECTTYVSVAPNDKLISQIQIGGGQMVECWKKEKMSLRWGRRNVYWERVCLFWLSLHKQQFACVLVCIYICFLLPQHIIIFAEGKSLSS